MLPSKCINLFSHFLRSLLLTTILSFSAPLLIIGVILTALFLVAYIPGIEAIAQMGITHILNFLTIFGSGCPWQGVLIISITCSFVAGLFDTYAFYSYPTTHNH